MNFFFLSRLYLFIKNKKVFLYLFFVLYLILFNFVYIYFFSSTEIDKIIIKGHNFLTKQEILLSMNLNYPLEVNSTIISTIEKRLDKNPRIKKSLITLSQKNLLVEVKEERAVWLVHTNNQFYEIAENGFIISKNDIRDYNLSIISGNFTLEGNYFNQTFQQVFNKLSKVLDGFPSLKQRISEIRLTKKDGFRLYLDYPSSMEIRLPYQLTKSDIQKVYYTLAYFEYEKSYPKYLDLRGIEAIYY